jgi:maleylacetate reductase
VGGLSGPSACSFPAERLVFGDGAIGWLRQETSMLGSRPLVVASRRWRDLALAKLEPVQPPVISDIAQHVPIDLAADAVEVARSMRRDVVVAVGGGSAVGLAKIVARDLRIPVLAVPTTLSGSERTPIWGLTREGAKQTGRDEGVLPSTVLYDPALVASLPPRLGCESAMNALAHAVEGMWVTGNPFIHAVCAEAIRTILPPLAGLLAARKLAAPPPGGAWADLLVGASIAGSVLALAGTGIHHAVAHDLGGRFGLPHATLHTLLLPYTSQLVALHDSGGLSRVGSALAGVASLSDRRSDVPAVFYEMSREILGEPGLFVLGVAEDELLAAVPEFADLPLPDGSPLSDHEYRHLLRCAYRGQPPSGCSFLNG